MPDGWDGPMFGTMRGYPLTICPRARGLVDPGAALSRLRARGADRGAGAASGGPAKRTTGAVRGVREEDGMKTIHAADLFCGAGGASVGLRRATTQLGLSLDLLAVNHWTIAVQTHSLNHPDVRHLCESVERINPRDVIQGGRLQLLIAAPECTNHSRARGGRPINDQSRATAWHILKWAQELYIDNILIENVEEFREWGPLGANGKPLKTGKGQTYRAFIEALRSLGYRVEDRVLNAADYGDPTTRRRLFIMARRGKRAIEWPAATHSRTGAATLFGKTKHWRAAREVIDWTIPSRSIFQRTKALSPKTLARIVAGLRRFGGQQLEPFLVCMEHGQRERSLDAPLPTITTARGGAMALVEPFILQQQSGGAPRGVDQPLPTITTDGAQALVEPFLLPFHGERQGQPKRVHSLDDPMPTQTTENCFALVEPFVASYYGTQNVSPVSAPLPTVTTKDRFALVLPVVNGQMLDVRLRMLKPHELAAAMSFDRDYQFAGTKSDQVKQIGNAWPCRLGQALIGALLADYADAKPVAWKDEATA